VPPSALRAIVDLTWRARLQPTCPGWIDMALGVPIMDVSRAREELGWEPRRSSVDAFLELFEGLHDRAGLATPPLDPGTGGPMRVREILTRVGGGSR
jgi:hypothetical protein